MFGLTPLGIVHTAISLIAVISGSIALIRDGKISWDNQLGKIYTITTIVTCLTGFGIFQHGGFGKPHILGLITLTVFETIYLAHKSKLGKISPIVETVGYSLTFLFNLIPGITETATRLPLDGPLATSPEDPNIKMTIGVCFLLFLVLATMQVRKMRSNG
jgi:uncharacterized membrane protein